MKRFSIFIFILYSAFGFSQSEDTLYINYHSHSPFSFNDGQQKGIETDIMNEYILWLKSKKKINITFKYTEFTDFTSFYNATKKAPKNTIGLGSVTITSDRLKEADITTPYLKNVAFCVTNGNAPDVKVKSADDIMRGLGSMSALTMSNTSLSRYVAEIKKSYVPELKVSYVTEESRILDEIARNVLSFGYVDAIGFWFYVKNNPGKFLKVQKVLSQSKEELGFVMPKGSKHKVLFDEFFAGAGGFKTSPTYRSILEKYLGSYMTQNVAIN